MPPPTEPREAPEPPEATEMPEAPEPPEASAPAEMPEPPAPAEAESGEMPEPPAPYEAESAEPPDSARTVAEILGLRPHPEGGWYAETWREPAPEGERPASSAIYYLLRSGERSAWHRIDATEVWHHYAGAPLELRLSRDGVRVETHRLGTDLAAGERPQVVVPAGAWQAARSLGAWTLVGCTVAPAFEFARFELAPPGWEPGRTR